MAQYPTAAGTDANLFVAKNNLSTTLSDNPLTSGATTVNVASTTGFPAAGYITIQDEAIAYTGITGTSFTGCTRGADSTTATSHVTGLIVYHNLVAAHHNALKDEVIAIETDLVALKSAITPVTATSTATNVLNRLAMICSQIKNIGGLTNWYDAVTAMLPLSGGTTTGAVTVTGDLEAVLNPGSNNPARGVISTRFATDQSSAHFSGKKARGTLASPSPVQALDYITALVPNPWDGFQYLIPGEAVWQVAPGTVVSNGVVPVDFVVQTGTGTPGDGTDRMRVGYDGKVNIGLGNNTVDANGTLTVKAIASTNAIRLSTADASFAALDITSTGGASAVNVAQGNLNFATSGNGIKGTTTNDSASTGIVGEVISATQTATNFPTTDQWGNNASISLTAGDWDIYVQANYPGTAVTGVYWGAGYSSTTGNSTTGLTLGDTYLNEVLDSKNHSVSVTGQVKVASTTTYYLKVLASYSVGTPQYSGKIWARRAR